MQTNQVIKAHTHTHTKKHSDLIIKFYFAGLLELVKLIFNLFQLL